MLRKIMSRIVNLIMRLAIVILRLRTEQVRKKIRRFEENNF